MTTQKYLCHFADFLARTLTANRQFDLIQTCYRPARHAQEMRVRVVNVSYFFESVNMVTQFSTPQ